MELSTVLQCCSICYVVSGRDGTYRWRVPGTGQTLSDREGTCPIAALLPPLLGTRCSKIFILTLSAQKFLSFMGTIYLCRSQSNGLTLLVVGWCTKFVVICTQSHLAVTGRYFPPSFCRSLSINPLQRTAEACIIDRYRYCPTEAGLRLTK